MADSIRAALERLVNAVEVYDATGMDVLGDAIAAARAVLSRWGHQPTPPAEGEVGELVKYLRGVKSLHCQRAAELLQQQHPAPVPVSERLPGPEDCDGEGRCWAGTRAFVDTSGDRDIDYPPSWELREVRAQDDVWLPSHALPLPQGEVE